MIDEKEFFRWFKQAEHNLRSAKSDAQDDSFDWACFKAQQAAEMAVKALIVCLGKIVKGHSIFDLLKTLELFGFATTEELLKCARKLDKFYIPTRYPDAIGLGSPFESFDSEDFEVALRCSEAILLFVKKEFENVKDN
ncbi:MAG: HEPN domain-containing protein [Thermodesulfovibrionales bacterium]|nr:HEPN domain-containing protein [Thermodesulfovibrionales bacterium]